MKCGCFAKHAQYVCYRSKFNSGQNFPMLSDSYLVTLIHEQLGQGDSKLKGTEIENKPKNGKMLL